MTPRQTCPRPNGFGRNLRSKTRWFAGFCNSHQVSHFATFFIDARAEISVAESRFGYDGCRCTPPALRERDSRGAGNRFEFSLALSAPGLSVGPSESFRARTDGARRGRTTGRVKSPRAFPAARQLQRVRGRPFQVSTMILPQVHLRKPCYDFSFL